VPADRLAEFIVQLPPCMIAMEACSTAHHWARRFAGFGHTVRLIAPQFVTPYRKGGISGKNDAADAEAICEAASRPSMRFLISDKAQQAHLVSYWGLTMGFTVTGGEP
jgi:transposase